MNRNILLILAVLSLLVARYGDHDYPGPETSASAPVLVEAVGQSVPGECLPATEPLAPTRAAAELPGGKLAARLPQPLVKIAELQPAVQKYAREHGVDEDLVWAVMRHESGFDPRAVSPKGAMGLMQLMPGTASLMGVSDPFDIEQNIEGGIKYLEDCLNRFNQDIALALAAYNAGPQNVIKYQGCPPFQETRQYVAAVLQTYSGQPKYRRLSLAATGNDELTAVVVKTGLNWRIPFPRFRVTGPQFHVRPPRWKRATGNLATMTR